MVLPSEKTAICRLGGPKLPRYFMLNGGGWGGGGGGGDVDPLTLLLACALVPLAWTLRRIRA